ncbi:hypothetical protein GCM10010317_077370 [Streptomyces mirabilis]|nr:hypothetical protein [Streptomyces mirabilis]GHD70313.1 hypothetical protein GCM10010317_077370 [Streptomyces mirabilis]
MTPADQGLAAKQLAEQYRQHMEAAKQAEAAAEAARQLLAQQR